NLRSARKSRRRSAPPRMPPGPTSLRRRRISTHNPQSAIRNPQSEKKKDGRYPSCRPRSKRSPMRWPTTRGFSSSARASASAAATDHRGNYYPMYAHFPGLGVVVPSTPYDAKGLLHHALRCDDPVLFLEHRDLLSLKGPVPEGDYEIPFGQAAVVREGQDVTVVALALMVQRALQTCATLAAEGVSVELIDPRTVAPLD